MQVQPEVTEWVFRQADIIQNGSLSVMELARALVAFDMWLGKRTQCSVAPDQVLVGIVKNLALSQPDRRQSSFCVVS